MNIYVGNLNYRVREDDLKSVMEQFLQEQLENLEF